MHRLSLLALIAFLLVSAPANGADSAPSGAVGETAISQLKPGAQSVVVGSRGRIRALGGGGSYGTRKPLKLARLLEPLGRFNGGA